MHQDIILDYCVHSRTSNAHLNIILCLMEDVEQITYITLLHGSDSTCTRILSLITIYTHEHAKHITSLIESPHKGIVIGWMCDWLGL